MKTIANQLTEMVKRNILKNVKFVYHGTFLSKLESIKQEGLTTNTKNGNNNFDGLSKPDSIYFTTKKKYAFNFVRWKSNEPIIILKVPVEALVEMKLISDENFRYDSCYGSSCFRVVNATIKEFEVEVIRNREAFIKEYCDY